MYDVQVVPIVGACDDGFPASRREMLPEELDVAIILTELNLRWESATLFLREEFRDKKGNAVWRGAVIDFYLPELDVLIEVRRFGKVIIWEKGKKEPHKYKQQRLARQYGYGFAVVHRLAFYNRTTLRRKVIAAIVQAIADRDRTRQKNPDWQRSRALLEVDRRFLIVVRRTG